MHKILLPAAILIIFFHTAHAQENIRQPELKKQIDSLYHVDQQVQLDFIEAYQNSLPIDSLKEYENIKNETFKRHIIILKDIIKNYGFPTPQLIGKESASNFFVLIQHADADIDFQSAMLPFIKEQADQKIVDGSEYAYLYDRIMINTGKEQLYGTQLDYDSGNNAIPKKLADKETVNERRLALGMEPLEEYLANATEMHKQMNGIK